jgi:hypothetical protein
VLRRRACRRQEPRLLGTLAFGGGAAICGVGLLHSGLLCAAGRAGSGNVQVQAWELVGDGRELAVLPTALSPSTVWDALQSVAGKAALAGGEAACCARVFGSCSAGGLHNGQRAIHIGRKCMIMSVGWSACCHRRITLSHLQM